jgi:hypothetical protein
MLKGSCLCGAITFEAKGAARDPAACHCSQCRKQSGHFWAAANISLSDLTITGTPQWYEASPNAKRGFCPTCGSFLFWKGHNEDEMGVALGAVDGPTGLTLTRHIFVADKGDYYDITDGIRQEDQEDE